LQRMEMFALSLGIYKSVLAACALLGFSFDIT